MTSAINPNNIDGAYPVAGQDNDSQGFRDNFTNTKTNFNYAATEITDLQSKAVLKAALTGTTLNNAMNNSSISDVQLFDVSSPKAALGTVTSATLNYAASPYYTLATGGAVAISFSNFPPAGQVCTLRLQVTVSNTAHTLVLPVTVAVGINNLQGYASNVISFNQTGVYEYEFETSDGGSTISIFDLNRNRDPIYLPSSESLANGAAVSLTKSVSYIVTTGAGQTATLAAGAAGQVKMFAMTTDGGGNMVITVTNPAWGGSGTMTFGDVGDGCTLIYINSKWCCVGNNGVVFA
jgi:hypothetical protein